MPAIRASLNFSRPYPSGTALYGRTTRPFPWEPPSFGGSFGCLDRVADGELLVDDRHRHDYNMVAFLDLIRNPEIFSHSGYPEMVPDTYATDGVHHRALATRQVGARCFVSVHIQVLGRWSIK